MLRKELVLEIAGKYSTQTYNYGARTKALNIFRRKFQLISRKQKLVFFKIKSDDISEETKAGFGTDILWPAKESAECQRITESPALSYFCYSFMAKIRCQTMTT